MKSNENHLAETKKKLIKILKTDMINQNDILCLFLTTVLLRTISSLNTLLELSKLNLSQHIGAYSLISRSLLSDYFQIQYLYTFGLKKNLDPTTYAAAVFKSAL